MEVFIVQVEGFKTEIYKHSLFGFPKAHKTVTCGATIVKQPRIEMLKAVKNIFP
jgi:hypothetical protein